MASLATGSRERIDQILSEAVESKSTPALFFGVTNVEEEIYMHQAGMKLVDDPVGGFIDEHSVFWLCSQTKLITTIAALQLIEQGKIGFDTCVDEILPELANPVIVTGSDGFGKLLTTRAKGRITFGQLLNHSSGLDYYVDGTTPASGIPLVYSHSFKPGEDVSTFFKIIQGSLPGVPLRFEPGTNFGYGFSSDCAGFIIERLTVVSAPDCHDIPIWEPCRDSLEANREISRTFALCAITRQHSHHHSSSAPPHRCVAPP